MSLLLSTILFTGWLLTSSVTAAPIQKRVVRGPVISTDFPDPSIIQVGQTWYAFGTQSIFDYRDVKVQLATSPDAADWTVTGRDMLASLPAWADASNPLIWAPHVIQRNDNTFLMYFSATTRTAGNGRFHCIGTAVSNQVDGPYYSNTDTPFACPTDRGGAIDASGFRDSDGSRYVLYKVDANSLGHGGVCNNGVAPILETPIILQQVQQDGFTPVGPAREILSNGEFDGPLVEAPSMMRAADGTYVLFFSSNCYTTTAYDVSYATSASLDGPFVKAQYPIFVTAPSPSGHAPANLYGPGGASVATDGRTMVFHGYESSQEVGRRRAMYSATIDFADGVVRAWEVPA